MYFKSHKIFSVFIYALVCNLFFASAWGNTESEQEQPSFDIWEYRISGNTVLTNRQIELAVYPHLGPDKSFETVQAAQLALQELYRDEGYSFANITIPEQDVDNGVVKLKVTEGNISRVKISGNKYFSRKEIRKKIASLEKGSPARLPDVQQELLELNRANPDRQVVPIARAGRDPETVEIELRVQDQLPFSAGFEFNGRNSPDTTRTRASVSLGYSNLWQKNHNISFNFQTTPEDRSEVEVTALNYSLPIFDSDKRLLLYWIESDSDIATVADTTVVGDGTIFGIKTLLPIYGEGRLFQSLSFGLESKDFGQVASLSTGAEASTPIRYSTANADYFGSYGFDQSALSFGGGIRLGLRGLGNSEAEFEGRRIGARDNFIYFVGNAAYLYTFENDSTIQARTEFQFTGDPLIGNEQYSAGGQFNVRGYLTSQELSDEAIFASLEYRSPNLNEFFSTELLPSLQLLSFVDYAKLHNRGTLPGEVSNVNLAGIGFGLRANLLNYLDVNLDFAKALSDSLEGSDSVDSGDTRFHFTLSSQF